MKVTSKGKGFSIKGDTYILSFDPKKPLYVDLTFSNGVGSELFVASGCDRDEYIDCLQELGEPAVKETAKKVTVTFTGKTTLWKKVDYIFTCEDNKVLYNYKVTGKGNIDNARFFESFLEEDPRMDKKFFPYFPGWGRHVAFHRPVKQFATSSSPKFDQIFSFTVNASDTRLFQYYESTKIRVGGDRFYLGGDWLVTPPPFLFLMGKKDNKGWVSMGLVAKAGENNFTQYEYLGGEGWGLNLDYQGYTEVKTSWESPKIMFELTKTDEYDALESYVGYLRSNNLVAKNKYRAKAPRWWYEPIFGGWGEQMVYSSHWPDYFKSTSTGWSGGSDGFCTRKAYERMLGQLEEKGVNPTILIVDNRWFQKPHHLDYCPDAWPKMREFVDQQHAKGRRVILWISPWGYNRSKDAAGQEVPVCEHLVLDKDKAFDLEIDTDVFYKPVTIKDHDEVITIERERKKKRIPATFNLEERHWNFLADPFNPDYVKRVQEKVQFLLGKDGLDCDGFEFDYTHFLPIYRGTVAANGRKIDKWGVEMLHKVIEIYYTAAKKAKKDALVIDHIFNPYFDDVTDMLRMQDIYTDNRSICDQMHHRGKIARRVCPDCAIHSDQHPMPSLEAWREYATYQAKFGNPCTYYVTAIETTREEITDEDYKMLREEWERYDKELTKRFGPKKPYKR